MDELGTSRLNAAFPAPQQTRRKERPAPGPRLPLRPPSSCPSPRRGRREGSAQGWAPAALPLPGHSCRRSPACVPPAPARTSSDPGSRVVQDAVPRACGHAGWVFSWMTQGQGRGRAVSHSLPGPASRGRRCQDGDGGERLSRSQCPPASWPAYVQARVRTTHLSLRPVSYKREGQDTSSPKTARMVSSSYVLVSWMHWQSPGSNLPSWIPSFPRSLNSQDQQFLSAKPARYPLHRRPLLKASQTLLQSTDTLTWASTSVLLQSHPFSHVEAEMSPQTQRSKQRNQIWFRRSLARKLLEVCYFRQAAVPLASC